MPRHGWARRACSIALIASLTLPGIASAQEQAVVAPTYLDEPASPFGKVDVSNEDAAKVEMPKLAFESTAVEEKDFDKYYYFHRAGTDFASAYLDLVECDGYARGLASGIAYTQTPYPYAGTLAGAAGGVIANVMIAAIFGSAEKRRLRRVNMRQCMHFKGYQRYGLKKDLWEDFNFEEGFSGLDEARRFAFLKRQALVASAVVPQGKELGL